MSKYGVSERLQGMMCTEPVHRSTSSTTPDEAPKPGPSSTPSSPSSPSTQHAHSTLRFRNAASKSFDQPRARVNDIESGPAVDKLDDPEEIQRMAAFKTLTFAQVTNQIWHFCSVDHGPKCTFSFFLSFFLLFFSFFFLCVCVGVCVYLYTKCSANMVVTDTCIGYNSLHMVKDVRNDEIFNGNYLPDGKRVWSWLVLFDDGTISGNDPLFRDAGAC